MNEIIKYPETAINELYANQHFVSLLLNIPNVDLSDPTVKKKYIEHVLDYGYVEETITEAGSYCLIDTEIFNKSPTIKTVLLNITVLVHKGVMQLPPDFKSFGNRRDNLIREIDYTLRGNNKFGIGGLENTNRITPVYLSNNFSAKKIYFAVPSFAL